MDASHLELSHSVSVYWYVMHLLKSSPNLLHEVCKDVDIDILSQLLEDEPVSHAQLGTADGNMLLLKRCILCKCHVGIRMLLQPEHTHEFAS